ncbi:hypothetical protein [Rhodophyticola sp.]|uniref:hypothetical protein n=1 Tax=Rhodophyticola sp. TaxID=2680032 RepID=UPI003D2B20C2
MQFLDEDTGPSIVVATTNLPGILDRAALQPLRSRVALCEVPDGPAIRQALERRMMGFSFNRIGWKRVTDVATWPLNGRDIVAAAEDAARRAVLNDTDKIATQDLLDALERRRSLQELGTDDNGARPSTLPPFAISDNLARSKQRAGAGSKRPSDRPQSARRTPKHCFRLHLVALPDIPAAELPGVYLEVRSRVDERLEKDSLDASGLDASSHRRCSSSRWR